MRRIFFVLFTLAAVALALLAVLPVLVQNSVERLGERLGGGSRNFVNESLSTGYVFEEGAIAYRPRSTGAIIAANVISLGTVGQPEWLVGKRVRGADARSFEVLAQRFGRDKRAVYFEWTALSGVDLATFAPVGYGYAQDRSSVWAGRSKLFSGLTLSSGDVVASSDRVFAVAGQGYYLKDAPVPLSEVPQTEVITACRDWYQMNGTLWFADTRLDAPVGPIAVHDCDGSIRSGPNGEMVEDNRGLLFSAGNTAYVARITGDVETAYVFDAAVVDAAFLQPDYRENLMIAQLADDSVVVVDLTQRRVAQVLGVFPDLEQNSFKPDVPRVLWLRDAYFVFNADSDQTIYTAHGVARKEGKYIIGETGVFAFGSKIPGADPATFEVMGRSVAQDRGACFVSGRYVGDLLPAETDTAFDACFALKDATYVTYDGLKISFDQDFKRFLDGDARQQGDAFVYDYHLGTVRVENMTDDVLAVDPEFYADISAWIRTGDLVEVDVERPVLDLDGAHALEPRQGVSWPLKVRIDTANLNVGFYMTLQHSPQRRARFAGEETLRFVERSLSGAPVVPRLD